MSATSHYQDSLSTNFSPAAARPSPRKRKRPAPFSIRFNDDERARLDKDAAGRPLGAYIKAKVFDGRSAPHRKSSRPSIDHQKLALVLSALGQSRLANNINQLAKAANMGTLDVSVETQQSIQTACAEIIALRQMLIEALGLKAESGE